MAAMVIVHQPIGAMAPLGPGMGWLDSLRLHVFADYNVLFDAGSLCSLETDRWPPLIFAEITGMWASMLLATVFYPTARRLRLPALWRDLSGLGRIGICTGAITFCGLLAVLQVCAQILGLVSDHLRVEGWQAQAGFLVAALGLGWMKRQRFFRSELADPVAFGSSFRWSFAALFDCVPMVLLMFPLGLMNIVAMAGMTSLNPVLRRVVRGRVVHQWQSAFPWRFVIRCDRVDA